MWAGAATPHAPVAGRRGHQRIPGVPTGLMPWVTQSAAVLITHAHSAWIDRADGQAMPPGSDMAASSRGLGPRGLSCRSPVSSQSPTA